MLQPDLLVGCVCHFFRQSHDLCRYLFTVQQNSSRTRPEILPCNTITIAHASENTPLPLPQLQRRSELRNPPLIHDKNAIVLKHGTQPMGNSNQCLPPQAPGKCLLYDGQSGSEMMETDLADVNPVDGDASLGSRVKECHGGPQNLPHGLVGHGPARLGPHDKGGNGEGTTRSDKSWDASRDRNRLPYTPPSE